MVTRRLIFLRDLAIESVQSVVAVTTRSLAIGWFLASYGMGVAYQAVSQRLIDPPPMMNHQALAIVVALTTLAQSLSGAVTHQQEIPYFLQDRQEIYQKSPRQAALNWFSDARMGMMIHWGVWGKHHAAWAMFNQKIPIADYQKMARQVDATGFDAEQIVKLAEDAGMRYITFVAKHHDGFCLWDSKFSDFDSMDYPLKRDFVAELAKACRAHQMPLFLYYSIGIDWTHPYYLPKELYDVGRPHYAQTPDNFKYREPADFEHYRQFCKDQLTELTTNYGPIAGFWFDTLGGVLANSEMFKMEEFYEVIHQHQPHALILFKTGATGTEDVLVGERELKSIAMHYGNQTPQQQQIRKLAEIAWSQNFKKKAEIAVTSQGTWEWTPTNRCADADKLWMMLESASHNNANLLLNFGPCTDGSIPSDVAANFHKLGERIRAEGFPPLNTTTYLKLRADGALVDQSEKEKTAR